MNCQCQWGGSNPKERSRAIHLQVRAQHWINLQELRKDPWLWPSALTRVMEWNKKLVDLKEPLWESNSQEERKTQWVQSQKWRRTQRLNQGMVISYLGMEQCHMMSRKHALRMIQRQSTITSIPKSKFRMNHNPCHTTAVPYAEALGYIPKPSTLLTQTAHLHLQTLQKVKEEKGPLTINR